MIEIELKKPCLSCPYADVVVLTEEVKMCGHDEVAYEKTIIACEHAKVCSRIIGDGRSVTADL